MIIPFGVVGSVHVTCSEVEELAVTLGGATSPGAVKERKIIIICTYNELCMSYIMHSRLNLWGAYFRYFRGQL